MFETITDWLSEWGGVLMIVVIVLAVLFGGYEIIKAMINSEQQWQQFKIDHHCKLINQTDGQWIYGYSTNGHSHSYYQSGSVTYKCDNGVTYTKGEGE